MIVVGFQYSELKKVVYSTVFFDKWVFSGRSSGLLKKMALGYDLVLADFLWLRSVQSFGGRGMSSRDWRPVYYQYDALTDIDPQMEHAYTFGNMVIGDEGRQQAAGIELIEKGMRYDAHREKSDIGNKPEGYHGVLFRYKVPFDGMYVSNWTLSDKTKARFYGKIAENALNAPDWVNRMVAYLEVEDGEYFVGVDRYIGNLLQGLESNQDYLVAISISRLGDAINKWNTSLFEKAYKAYKDSHAGNEPNSLLDLAAMADLKDYETVNFRRIIALVETLQRKIGGRSIPAESMDGAAMPLQEDFEWADSVVAGLPMESNTKISKMQNTIFKSVIEKRTGLPISPYKTDYVWNPAFAGHRSGTLANPVTNEPLKFVMTEAVREDVLRTMLKSLRGDADAFKEREGRLPEDLNEIYDTVFVTPEPYGGRWIYDKSTGTIKSSSHPDF